MIPLKDDNPIHSTPVVTIAVIAACVIVFLYQQFVLASDAALNAFLDRYAFDYAAFVRSLTRGGPTLATVAPLFTHMFLHANWLHIGGENLFFLVFCQNLPGRLRTGRLPP